MLKLFLIILFVGVVECAPPSVRGPADEDLKSKKLFVETDSEKIVEKSETIKKSSPIAEEKESKTKKLLVVDSAAEKNQKEKLEKIKPPQVDKPQLIPKKRPDLVRRPDHLDAVPIERDGNLNKNYRQEILFGDRKSKHTDDNDGDVKMSKEKSREPENLLKEVFTSADKNKNGKLSSEELENFIQENTLKHLDDAVEESKRVFDIIDSNSDGFATWEEYHYHFLIDNEIMDADKAKKHDESHVDLPPEDQEKIETEIQEWHEADDNPKDSQLSPDEFLAFRHPEHSRIMLNSMVQEIIRALDKDNDNRLSEDEFVATPIGTVDKQWEKYEQDYLQERRKEFKSIIDLDKDGFASFKELVQYTNPRNPQHAKVEVKELMEVADENGDHELSLDEVMEHKAIFLGSSLINAEKNMHDEF